MSAPDHLAGLGDAATHLKHAETVDKSAPAIDGDVKIKKAPKRTEILAGIDNVTLKHAETVDKSAPIIESDVHIKPSAHAGLMAAIKKD